MLFNSLYLVYPRLQTMMIIFLSKRQGPRSNKAKHDFVCLCLCVVLAFSCFFLVRAAQESKMHLAELFGFLFQSLQMKQTNCGDNPDQRYTKLVPRRKNQRSPAWALHWFLRRRTSSGQCMPHCASDFSRSAFQFASRRRLEATLKTPKKPQTSETKSVSACFRQSQNTYMNIYISSVFLFQ